MNTSAPTPAQIRRWQQYLANERAEASVYRQLAHRRSGEERDILLRIAEAESRHERYWEDKLGDAAQSIPRADLRTRMLAVLARRFGSVFSLALMQSAESRSPYADDEDASGQISADERIHAEVVRGLASRGRERMSGTFRAAVFGANDGLVSNLALVLGVMASGVSPQVVLVTGVSGLLSGALSMAAGEYISVKSQNELLEASAPNPDITSALPELDVNANELELVYRARGMSQEAASQRASQVFAGLQRAHGEEAPELIEKPAEHGTMSSARSAALSSFIFFASGALIPILPFIFGATGLTGGVISLVLVGLALLCTGGITGVLSGKPPTMRALRQLGIGYGAAAVTYVLGLVFGTVIG
ncbi:VIT1/CCC1 transporter family protein [Corynebacterium pacaense]|uniref:VIT1/CCC1 transporter family protein n=1 Tax=Corynebacterium pacaense TaxID=1816684 RepID=UPI0009B9AFA1|nr:VIT1/CCC1 transporter family protein [Corynebacterium pacaense]